MFEGWSKNADGSFAMHFGYLNRNWVQELVDPGRPEQQRRARRARSRPADLLLHPHQRNLFTVTVPKDCGKKEADLDGDGQRQDPEGVSAGCSLSGKSIRPAAPPPADRPTRAEEQQAADDHGRRRSDRLPLARRCRSTAAVVDDGMPKPAAAKKPAVGQETPPAARQQQRRAGQCPAARAAAAPRRRRQRRRRPRPVRHLDGLARSGQRDVRIAQHPGEGRQGAEFGRLQSPGEYVLRARASDRILFTDKEVKVTVTGGATPSATSDCAHRVFVTLVAASAALGITGVATREHAAPRTSRRRPSRFSSTRMASSPRTPARPAIPSEYSSWHASYHRTMTQAATPDTAVANFDGVTVAAVHGRPMRLSERGQQLWAEFDDPDSSDLPTRGRASSAR